MRTVVRLLRALGGGPVKATIGLVGTGLAAIVLAVLGQTRAAILVGLLACWCAVCLWLLVHFDDLDSPTKMANK